jgi:hypothetical protein
VGMLYASVERDVPETPDGLHPTSQCPRTDTRRPDISHQRTKRANRIGCERSDSLTYRGDTKWTWPPKLTPLRVCDGVDRTIRSFIRIAFVHQRQPSPFVRSHRSTIAGWRSDGQAFDVMRVPPPARSATTPRYGPTALSWKNVAYRDFEPIGVPPLLSKVIPCPRP